MKKQQYAPSSAEEERFLREYNPSKYPKAGFAVDVNLFAYDEEGGKLWVLLIERGGYPYKGCYAFPGGFMDMDETAEQAAARELEEETGLTGLSLEEHRLMADVHRDPRDRVLTAEYLALARREELRAQAGDDAARAEWFALEGFSAERTEADGLRETVYRASLRGPEAIEVVCRERVCYGQYLQREFCCEEQGSLAFDHGEALVRSILALQDRLLHTELAYNIWRGEFGLEELRRLYHAAFLERFDYVKIPNLRRLANGLFTFRP